MVKYSTMKARIALPFADGAIFTHFGKTAAFKIYTLSDDKIVDTEVAATEETGHDAMGLWLIQHEVDLVICDSIGPAAQGALRAAGILLIPGISGSTDDAIARLLAGEIFPQTAATCSCGSCGSCGHTCGGSCGSSCHGHG